MDVLSLGGIPLLIDKLDGTNACEDKWELMGRVENEM
jgi:hypothetical protein